jgi:hypothetical protein
MRIQFLYEARLEFLNAITHYEEQRPGLGRRFKAEIEQSLLAGRSHRGLSAEVRRVSSTKDTNLSVFNSIYR